MQVSEMVELLVAVQDKHGDVAVQVQDPDGEMTNVEVIRFLKPTDYHGAILELEVPAVVILPWEFDDEDDNPD